MTTKDTKEDKGTYFLCLLLFFVPFVVLFFSLSSFPSSRLTTAGKASPERLKAGSKIRTPHTVSCSVISIEIKNRPSTFLQVRTIRFNRAGPIVVNRRIFSRDVNGVFSPSPFRKISATRS